MKILVIPPLTRKITPQTTASRPSLIFELTAKLKEKGHHIAVLGTADSKIPHAKIIPITSKGFYELSNSFENPFYSHIALLTKQANMAVKLSSGFDIVHNHSYPEFFPLLCYEKIKPPILTTIHAQITPLLDETLSFFPKTKLVAISKTAKKQAKKANIYKVIYNGIDQNIFSFSKQKDDYLLWLGRLSKAKNKNGKFQDPKGVKWAIKLAEAANSRLLLSGSVEDTKFFEQEVKPHLSSKIKWIGKISPEQPLTRKQVVKLMQKAKAFLMTINWREPFGLVMAEAMSCGTPVIGFARGSVPELVEHQKTGFTVNPKTGITGLIQALKDIGQVNPEKCRERVLEKFTLDRMAEQYEKTYIEMLKK